MSQYKMALDKYNQALQNFNYADPEHIDVAILELKAAEEMLNVVHSKMRGGESDVQKTGRHYYSY
jgi:hypothetical protein